MGVLAKRVTAAIVLVVCGVACRDNAMASGRSRDVRIALCYANHRVPGILVAYHADRISERTALKRLRVARRIIARNAAGPHAYQLRDVATALRLFEVVTIHDGDTGDAYRDLRTLREALPPAGCP